MAGLAVVPPQYSELLRRPRAEHEAFSKRFGCGISMGQIDHCFPRLLPISTDLEGIDVKSQVRDDSQLQLQS